MSAIGFVDFCEQVLGVRFTLGQRTLARVAFDRVEPARLDRCGDFAGLRVSGLSSQDVRNSDTHLQLGDVTSQSLSRKSQSRLPSQRASPSRRGSERARDPFA